MSVIYECDGCGKTTRDSREVKLATIEIKSQTGQGGRDYHLCDQYERLLRRLADPTKWDHPAKANQS